MINPDKARQCIEGALMAKPELRLATYDVGAPRLDCNCPAGILTGERYPSGRGPKAALVKIRPEQLEDLIRGFEGETDQGGWAKLGTALRAHERFIG